METGKMRAFIKSSVWIFGLAAALCLPSHQSVAATFQRLHAFLNSSYGAAPETALLRDAAGNLYGTSEFGGTTANGCGTDGCGTIFRLAPGGKLTVLHRFCKTTCLDGAYPLSPLLMGPDGNLYGTAASGGAAGWGTVFKLVLGTGRVRTLYAFTNGADGGQPEGALARDSNDNLYGATVIGGNAGCTVNSQRGSCGVVFRLTPGGTETPLYSFTGGADGGLPFGGVTIDGQGNLYGTASEGGVSGPCTGGCGVVFKVSPDGNETPLYAFCSQTSCATCPGGIGLCGDGLSPGSGLLQQTDGNLYGTTQSGGAKGFGIVFKVPPTGGETLLYSFCPAQPNCADYDPVGTLAADAAGDLYGMTAGGGAHSDGTVWELATDGGFRVLHSFCSASNCYDGEGAAASAGLIGDNAGHFYGVTPSGGTKTATCPFVFGCGRVFEVSP